MSLGATAILDKVVSHAMTLGLFEQVNAHEPKSKPGKGLTCAIWVDRITPSRSSGLSSSSALLVVNVRIYTSMLAQPQDAIDPAMLDAVDKLMTAYAGHFTLGGLVRMVDLHGMTDTALSAQAGYLNQDGTLFRVVTITVPLIINDAWEQAP